MMKQNIIAQPTNQPAQFSLVIAELIFSVTILYEKLTKHILSVC